MTASFQRSASPAALTAGLLWIVHVVLFVGFGAAHGGLLVEATGHPLWRLDGAVFTGVYAALGVTLIGLSGQVRTRAPRLGVVGAGLGAVPLVGGVVGGVLFLLAPGVIEHVMGFIGPSGILASFLGALVLGTASLRTKALSRQVGLLLVGFSLFTVPLAVSLPLLEGAVPLYVLYDLHFVAAGFAWIAIGAALRQAPAVRSASPDPTSVLAAP